MEESSQNVLDSKMYAGLCLALSTRTVFRFFTAKLIRKMASFRFRLRWKMMKINTYYSLCGLRVKERQTYVLGSIP